MRIGAAAAGPGTRSPGAYDRALADAAFRERFRSGYRGDADPLDALWWLEHPGDASPAGTESPWAAARRRRRRIYAPGATEAELDAARAAERRAVAVREAANAALEEALRPEGATAKTVPADPIRRPRALRPRRLPLLGGIAATAVVAAAVASLPAAHVDRPELARSLQAVFPGAVPRPADLLLALSGDGGETVAREVTGSAPLRITTVLCRGTGWISVRLSDRQDDTRMRCVAGGARLTRLLDAMPGRPFLATVVVSGRVAWSVTVADEHVRVDAETYPRCFGTEC